MLIKRGSEVWACRNSWHTDKTVSGKNNIQANEGKKEGKRGAGWQDNRPSYATTVALSWSQSLNHCQWSERAHGNAWMFVPVCTPGTPGGGSWNVLHLGSSWTGNEVVWKLADWLREAGLGRVLWRRNTHNTQDVCNNNTGWGGVMMITCSSTSHQALPSQWNMQYQKQYGRENAHLSVGGPGGQWLDHVWVPLYLSENR